MMAVNNNETAQEIPAQNYGQKLKKVLKEAEEVLKTENVQKIFKTVMPSVYGAVQALNTADDLLLKKSEASSNRQTSSPSPAKKELAVYKTLSEKEWQQYFGLIDTTQLSQEQSKRLRTYLKDNAEKEPYLRRLVRETIQHGKPITVSSTPDDWEKLKNDNATGVTDWKSRNISLLPEELVTPAMFHEILHIGQGDDGLGEESTACSREVIQKQRKLIEAEAMSVDYLCYYALNNTQDTLSDELANGKNAYEPDYFRKLVEKNKKELHQKQKDIPADLTDEEKELFIHTQAVNHAMGASIHILMQPEGKKTQEAAAAYDIELTDKDLCFVNWWKQFYNNDHKKWICGIYSKEEDEPTNRVFNLKKMQFIQNYMTNRYPDLKGKDFLVTGLTDAEQKSWDIREKGLYYSDLFSDEQIKAINLYYQSEERNIPYTFSKEADTNQPKTLPLTNEEMNYLQQLDEIQAGKKNETDMAMPASLKNLIETQEKTLQYHSQDKELAAFQKLEASRKELFEKENQQPDLAAAIKQNAQKCGSFMGHELESLTAAINAAQEYKENDNTSSTASRESGKER